MILSNSYFLLMQSKIIANIQKYINLIILDVISFSDKQLLHLDYCFIFIVIIYHSQEIFQASIIRYINFAIYIQYKIDNNFQDVRSWACLYIGNIICRAKFWPNILKKLRIFFDTFLKYNISIKSTKSFLNYLDIRLLG